MGGEAPSSHQRLGTLRNHSQIIGLFRTFFLRGFGVLGYRTYRRIERELREMEKDYLHDRLRERWGGEDSFLKNLTDLSYYPDPKAMEHDLRVCQIM